MTEYPSQKFGSERLEQSGGFSQEEYQKTEQQLPSVPTYEV